jgi:hypothetical protein
VSDDLNPTKGKGGQQMGAVDSVWKCLMLSAGILLIRLRLLIWRGDRSTDRGEAGKESEQVTWSGNSVQGCKLMLLCMK